MKLFNRKNGARRLLDRILGVLRPHRGVKARLPVVDSGVRLPDGVSKDTAAKAGMVAGGLAGITAASAGISALRRRERARDDS